MFKEYFKTALNAAQPIIIKDLNLNLFYGRQNFYSFNNLKVIEVQ